MHFYIICINGMLLRLDIASPIGSIRTWHHKQAQWTEPTRFHFISKCLCSERLYSSREPRWPEQLLHNSNSEGKRQTKPCLISFSSSTFHTDIQCQVQLKKTALQYRITAEPLKHNQRTSHIIKKLFFSTSEKPKMINLTTGPKYSRTQQPLPITCTQPSDSGHYYFWNTSFLDFWAS